MITFDGLIKVIFGAQQGLLTDLNLALVFSHLLLLGSQRVARVALSLDLRQKIFPDLHKVRVLEYLLVAALDFGLVEVVHVELADEGREVVMLEVLWQDLVAELLGLLDHEAVTLPGPSHALPGLVVVDYFEQFNQE